MPTVGFVGLGNMGGALASNLLRAGHAVVAHDAAGRARTPEGATYVPSVAGVAQGADVVVLSLPDGAASEQVARELIAAGEDRRTTHVVETSTVGVDAAQAIAELLAGAGVAYVDAPVSGGVAGARARTLAVIYAGPDDACAHVEPVLAGLSDRRHRVGDRAGLAQALKLANNFLSATTLAATSEAIAFGRSVGLDMATMLDVLDGASGRSAATSDKFPEHVLTERYASGFANGLMAKDVRLYLRSVEERGGPATVGAVTASLWERFATAEPGADFTRIFPFVEAGAGAGDRTDAEAGDAAPGESPADAPRVTPLPPAEWPEEMRAALAALRPAEPRHPYPRRDPDRPKGLNVLGTLARYPPLARAFHTFNGHVLFATTLTVRQRELAVLRVAALRHADYEWAQHVVLAGDAGITGDEVARVAEGPDAPGWSPPEEAILRAVDELLADALITDATWAALSRELDQHQLMDLVFTVGAYDTLAMAFRSFGIELDDDLRKWA